MADVHLHYNWDQAEVLTPQDAVRRLREHNVVFGVVSSKPPSLAPALAAEADGWILPFFMPYLEPHRKRDWFLDPRVLPAAREALESGRYKGLGEMHLIVGYAPSLESRHAVIDGLLSLAVTFDVPLSMHVEAGSHEYFQPLCRRHPRARILWAHAGGVIRPGSVAALMESCPNVWIDMSARDPLRYGGSQPITDAAGRLLPEWEQLVLAYQDRIMVGSDPFYRGDDSHWDEPNTGWDLLGEFIAFHRTWLSHLPEHVAGKIRLENALRFFGTSD
jgi:predicted TIM-barrel fold metal-dependent hydrolase